MNTPIIAFFNPKGGTGKTPLVYHLAWMYQDLGLKVIAADLDPQAHLTMAFLDEDRLEELWLSTTQPNTIYRCVQPIVAGNFEIAIPQLVEIEERLALFSGDLSLSMLESAFSKASLIPDEHSTQILLAFRQILQQAAQDAHVVLMDLASNLGAINYAALIAADYIIVPLLPDLSSAQSLKNAGTMLQRWHQEWKQFHPAINEQHLGYIILQQPIRLDRRNSYSKWIMQMPKIYHHAMFNLENKRSVMDDPYCLRMLKTYYSLISLAQEARKPIFHLKPADGAMGSYGKLVQTAYQDFQKLAETIAKRADLPSLDFC
jgi:cellulose biosynthesis protein BcsQ